jgi:predicted GNAT family acetyltransferase
MTDIKVVNNEAEHRYEAWLGEVLAGFTEYTPAEELITFTHTQVADAFEGKGVASTLIRSALDDVRAGAGRTDRPPGVRALRVQPLCPFVRGFIQRHEEYHDLLDAETH